MILLEIRYRRPQYKYYITSMTSSISNFKKRKSFLSVTRRMSLASNQSFIQPYSQSLPEEPQWHSLTLNASTFKKSSFTHAEHENVRTSFVSNKQNVPFNRAVIHFKPRQSLGGLIWMKEGGRSDLIRLERESIYSYD